MADKEYLGLWIPKGILACKKLKHVEKLVLAAAINLTDGLRMSDKKLADQLGVSESSIRGILRSMLDKGFLVKVGTHKTRKFLPTAQGYALTDDANCATLRTQPRKATHLTAQGCAQKEKKQNENKEADVVELKEASPQTTYNDYELDPDKRRANHQHNMEMAIACGLIKAK